MALNLYNLELQLAQRLNHPATEEELQFYAKALELVRNNAITVVSNFASLPAVTDAIAGELYFVQSEELIYIPVISLGAWRTLIAALYSSILTWGNNNQGRLGDNTIINKSSPVSVVGGFGDWCQASAGRFHNAAVRTNGSLWTWGYNSSGQLGDSTAISKRSPVSVVGGFTDWCQVSAGSQHTAAVRTNGSLWTWGCNTFGQLGNNTTTNSSSPVSVVGGFSDWCQVSAGFYHTAAVRTTGSLWTWGYNNDGQLGDNTIISKRSPVSVVGGFSDWCRVSSPYHTAAIRTNGTLWTWGSNSVGQMGDNTTIKKSSPVSVVGGFTDWCQVSASTGHSAAVRTNGTIWTWGRNFEGQLGDNTNISRSSPVSVTGGFTDWCELSAGDRHTAAIRTNSSIWTWGSNANGQLGDNTIVNKSSPVSVVGSFADWCQVNAGCMHTAAIRAKTF